MANREAARERFREGNRLFKVPLFARASEQYIAALSQWKHPAFYFNLALAQVNLGQEVEARGNFEQALKHGEEPLGTERFQVAQKQLQELEHQLGRLHLSCPTVGAEVTLDGATLFIGPGSYEGWVKAKAHEITARKPEYLSEARRVMVSPGEVKSLELKLITLSEAAESGRRWAPWKPWVAVAVGAAVVVGGGVLHVLSARDFNAYDKKFLGLDCAKQMETMPPGCAKDKIPPDQNAQWNRATQEQKIAVSGYVIGGTLIATGVVFLYLNRPRLAEQETTSLPPRNMAIMPMLSNDVLGVMLTANY